MVDPVSAVRGGMVAGMTVVIATAMVTILTSTC